MNSIDQALLLFVNSFVGVSENFDYFVRIASSNILIKGTVPVLLIWFLWFRACANQSEVRSRLVSAVVIAVSAIAVGRLLPSILPYRLRPIHADIDGLKLADGVSADLLDGWSSMPSDHAVMFFSLAFCLFRIHRGLGWVAILHAIFVISFPRVYLGYHYPGDILGGMVVAIMVAAILFRPVSLLVEKLRLLNYERTHPQFFHPVFFLVSLQIASMFDSAREVIGGAAGLAKNLLGV